MSTEPKYSIASAANILAGTYRDAREKLFGWSPALMNSLRDAAMENFQKTGFPGTKSEAYKYLNIEKLFESNHSQIFEPAGIRMEMDELFRCDIPELDTDVLVVLNGFYQPGKKLTRLPNGIIYGSMAAALDEEAGLCLNHYACLAPREGNALTALNTAFAMDGVFLYLPDNARLEKPIQIIHLLINDTPLLVQHRNLFILGRNSSASVIVCDHTLSSTSFLTNSVTEVFTGENASFDFTRMQNEHNQSIQLTNLFHHQDANSRVNSTYITLHGGTVRNNLEVNLEGEGAENNSIGLFLADMKQHVDTYTLIHHRKAHCQSNQLYKGVLDDEATGAFNGKIHVWKDAQHTQAYQRNNNILLTDTAKMNTRPQLEIYADDVKCSHGATVGQLDTDALFYLRSRGIPYKESMHLLMYAFAHAVLSEIKLLPLRERVIELVDKRLRGELSHCNNCKMKCK